MSLSAKLPKMALQPFEPEPHTVYTIETAAHFAQLSRRMVVVCCKHGLISPAAEPREHGYCFNGNAVRTLQRIQNLRTLDGMNLAGVRIILNLSDKVEELRSIVMHNGSPNQ
jgi:DNA-binding transcriptional MerR regulator